jgi:hypothetical protein
MAMTSGDSTEHDGRLRALLNEGAFDASRVASATYDISFAGELREWVVTAHLNEAWVLLRCYVMRLPESLHVRTMLLQAALEINADLPLTKFSVEGHTLFLDLEYFAAHLDSYLLSTLLRLIVEVGDNEYPKLFRIASGDVTLKTLESSFGLPNLT